MLYKLNEVEPPSQDQDEFEQYAQDPLAERISPEKSKSADEWEDCSQDQFGVGFTTPRKRRISPEKSKSGNNGEDFSQDPFGSTPGKRISPEKSKSGDNWENFSQDPVGAGSISPGRKRISPGKTLQSQSILGESNSSQDLFSESWTAPRTISPEKSKLASSNQQAQKQKRRQEDTEAFFWNLMHTTTREIPEEEEKNETEEGPVYRKIVTKLPQVLYPHDSAHPSDSYDLFEGTRFARQPIIQAEGN